MLFIVKHESGTIRLHESDGTEIAQFSDRPNQSEIADELSNPWRVSAEKINWRNLTVSGETVPW